jgi:hypothetical protein
VIDNSIIVGHFGFEFDNDRATRCDAHCLDAFERLRDVSPRAYGPAKIETNAAKTIARAAFLAADILSIGILRCPAKLGE